MILLAIWIQCNIITLVVEYKARAIKPKQQGAEMVTDYERVNLGFRKDSKMHMDLFKSINEYAVTNGISRLTAIRLLLAKALKAEGTK